MNSLKTFEVNISGIVQGVGFRPFLFNLARAHGLKGYILNRGNAGVRLVVQGQVNQIDSFISDVKEKKPKISFIETIEIKNLDANTIYTNIEIKKSELGRGVSLTLPPDVAVCNKCLIDMRNPNLKKYYQYPFIACAECGPRFTTVKELPYDRERSTMVKFPFCHEADPESCIHEYTDFNNRRFHAQTFACAICGPHYTLYNRKREIIENRSIEQLLQETANQILDGKIVAIKGIGGTHLVCLGDNDDIITKLRNRKGERKYKPFAIMVPNLNLIEKEFHISSIEKEYLSSYRRPIVILEKKVDNNDLILGNQIAPGLNNVGVMLPYSGIHYLLFDLIGEKPLVYTSGNKSYIPMGIENETIFRQLVDLADFFLLHNRPIFQRVDDSVLRIHNNKVKLVRRSRGYVPEYLPLPFKVKIPGAFATGPELSSTGAILRRNRIFPTQHIGDITHFETYDFLKKALFHMKNLLQINDIEVTFIACDLHPAFITTKFANELAERFNVKTYPIQHHFAHVLSLMAENKVGENEEIIGISTDGVGFGDDGNVWGGEILLVSYNGYKRLGHLEYQPMIGGDRCTKYPARMTASIVLKSLDIEEASKIFNRIGLAKDLEYKEEELKILISQYIRAKRSLPSENIPLSSSAGRILDVVSYLLGASKIKSYLGEPALRLEALASKGNYKTIKLDIEIVRDNGIYIINSSKLVLDVISLAKVKTNKLSDIADKFQREFALVFSRIAKENAELRGINKIGFTGGVAYNYSISKVIKEDIILDGFEFLEHNLIPPGDAGISTGQLIGGIFKSYETN